MHLVKSPNKWRVPSQYLAGAHPPTHDVFTRKFGGPETGA